MEVFFKNLNKSRIVAIILLITQSVCILPSQEIILNNKYSKIRLEQYLSRADREKNAQDWQRVAEEGILLAMSEWESANIYLRETNYEKYEEEYKRAYDEFETVKNSEFAAWYMNKRLNEENDLKRSEIAQLLSEKSEEYKKKYEGKGAEGGEIAKSKEEWESYATEIVENYMGELAKKNQSVLVEIIRDLKEQPFTDEELATIYTRVVNEYEDRVYEEYGRIYVAEKNQLMSVLLYDTKSTKKLSAAQAAEEIAKETAKAVKQEADIAMNELFEGFNAMIGTVEEDEIYQLINTGEPLVKAYMTYRDAKEIYRNGNYLTGEGDVSPEQRFSCDTFYDVEFPANIKPRIYFLDIETYSTDNIIPRFNHNVAEISAITIYDTYTSKYYCWFWRRFCRSSHPAPTIWTRGRMTSST